MKILEVEKNSIAAELGIRAGDELLSFDGHRATDVLDVEYYGSMESFVMTVKSGQEITDYEIEKYDDENLGVTVETEIPVKECCNKCVFCFVDQLPKRDLRKTLRVKDDDYRHSFISGNYVTLTNCSDSDIARIIRLRLSPIYVSVHTADYGLRNYMLGCKRKNPPDVIKQLRKLKKAGIAVHAQIVYCPEINEDYVNTCEVLSELTESLAIVPVGLTKDCNTALKPVDSSRAKKVIDSITPLQEKYLKTLNTRFVFLADEFYFKAGESVPPYGHYENFCQIENGVGLYAKFTREFDEKLNEIKVGKIADVAVATGVSAYPLIRASAEKLQKKFGGRIRVYAIENKFFGSSVTVAGLVVASDIISALKGIECDKLVIPRVMLKEFGDVFLDNLTLKNLSDELGVKVQVAETSGDGFITAVLEETI